MIMASTVEFYYMAPKNIFGIWRSINRVITDKTPKQPRQLDIPNIRIMCEGINNSLYVEVRNKLGYENGNAESMAAAAQYYGRVSWI